MFEEQPATPDASEKSVNPEDRFTFPTKPMTIDEVLEAMKKQGLDQAAINTLEKFNYALQNEKHQEESGRIAPKDTDINVEYARMGSDGESARTIEGEFKKVDSDK